MLEDAATLFERSGLAISEAKRLTEINEEWQRRTWRNIHVVFAEGARFEPLTDRKTNYPQDFPEQRRTYQPFPAEDPPDPFELL